MGGRGAGAGRGAIHLFACSLFPSGRGVKACVHFFLINVWVRWACVSFSFMRGERERVCAGMPPCVCVSSFLSSLFSVVCVFSRRKSLFFFKTRTISLNADFLFNSVWGGGVGYSTHTHTQGHHTTGGGRGSGGDPPAPRPAPLVSSTEGRGRARGTAWPHPRQPARAHALSLITLSLSARLSLPLPPFHTAPRQPMSLVHGSMMGPPCAASAQLPAWAIFRAAARSAAVPPPSCTSSATSSSQAHPIVTNWRIWGQQASEASGIWAWKASRAGQAMARMSAVWAWVASWREEQGPVRMRVAMDAHSDLDSADSLTGKEDGEGREGRERGREVGVGCVSPALAPSLQLRAHPLPLPLAGPAPRPPLLPYSRQKN